MSIILSRLARRFALTLNKKADDNDPFLKHPGQKGQYIDPEMTEDLDDVVKDSLHLVILMQRAFMEFASVCDTASGEKKELGSKLAEQVLFELQEIETNLQNPHLLEFLLNTEAGILDTIADDISMIKTALNLIKPWGSKEIPEAFKDLDQRVYKWLNELEENVTKLADESMGQSSFMEQHFAVEPRQMKDQMDEDIDQINREDIHPDHPDFEPEMDISQREFERFQSPEKGEDYPLMGNGPQSIDWDDEDEGDIEGQFDAVNDLIPKPNKSYHGR